MNFSKFKMHKKLLAAIGIGRERKPKPKPIPKKENIDAMTDILNRVRDVNHDKKLWDKLSGVEPKDIGFVVFYHNDSK